MAALISLVSLGLGCSGTDATGVPSISTTPPYAWLMLNVRAAVMATTAPYDTLQLRVTAYDAQGDVLPLPGPVVYTVTDTSLHASASGLLTLTGTPGSSATVIASVQDTIVRLTHVDTAFIKGTISAPSAPLAHFSIQPTGTDSAVLDINAGNKTLDVTALDATGKGIPSSSLAMHFWSDNTSLAKITNNKTGILTSAGSVGPVWLRASTTYYGVTMTDSLLFRIGYPDTTVEYTIASALPSGDYIYAWMWSNLVIGVGKTVIFRIPALVVNTTKLIQAGSNWPVGAQSVNGGVSVVFADSSAVQPSTLPGTVLATQYSATGSGNVSIQVPDSDMVTDTTAAVGFGTPQPYSAKLTRYCTTAPYLCATARSFPVAGTYPFHSATTGAVGVITVVAP